MHLDGMKEKIHSWDVDLSIVIPLKNEDQNVLPLKKEIDDVMQQLPYSWECLWIDDGSTDNTAAEAQRAGAKVFSHPYNIGNGAAIKSGIRVASGDILVFMDGDGQHNPQDIGNLIKYIPEFDMVVGARSAYNQASLGRAFGNKIYNWFASYVAKFRIKDLTSRNDSYYVVDGVSIVGGEELHMDKWGIDIAMTGAQKAFACPPGISPICVNARTKKYMIDNPPNTMYFNLPRYFKYYEEAKHTPFTPALPLLYAYREALDIILEEGLDTRIKRHRVCSDALYSGLSAIGLTPFAKEDSRSTVVIALNYLDGLEDKTFRTTLSDKFRVLVAGGFGNLKGKVFRVGCMGEVNRYHVMRTISAISSTLAMMGYQTDVQAGLHTAEEKLKAL